MVAVVVLLAHTVATTFQTAINRPLTFPLAGEGVIYLRDSFLRFSLSRQLLFVSPSHMTGQTCALSPFSGQQVPQQE